MNTELDLEVQHRLEPAGREPLTVKKAFRVLAAALIVLSGVLIISRMGHASYKDYISYWSAGKLLLQHGDPYARERVFALEKAAGYLGDRPIIMRNPPWALFLSTPLGWLSPETGVLWWTFAATGCIIAFLRLLKVSRDDRIFAFFFAPALGAFRLGQSSPFLLLGLSLFLYFYRTRPWLAGASLLLMAIKPHLFLVFWVVLLADCIFRRNYRILGGLAAALAVANTFALLFNPHIWHYYFTMLRTSDLNNEFFPTSSMLFRLAISRNTTWLLFVPSAAATVWGLWYYIRHRHSWDWKGHGMMVLLVAVMASPYGWFTDEIVLLPALAFAFNLPAVSPSRRTRSMAILAAIDVAALLIVLAGNFPVFSYAYMWTPIAWFAWFVYATWGFEGSSKNLSAPMCHQAQTASALQLQEAPLSS
jgi:Glycosyltransferase family 87